MAKTFIPLFGDIPIIAFIEANNIIKAERWVAFNIKESFFSKIWPG